MRTTLEDRLRREVAHGTTLTAIQQAEAGWDSPAGKIRRARRAQFLTQGLSPHTRVLEIGAGTGLQTTALLRATDNVDAIDISPKLLAIARTRAPGARYAIMDAHNPQFSPESFDAIVGVSILHHLDWRIALQNYLLLLKPGGIVRFSEPNLLNPQIFLQKNIPLLKRLLGDSPDEYAFTRKEITRVLRDLGYKEVRVRPFEFLHPATPQRLIGAVLWVEALIDPTPFQSIAGSLLIEAKKERVVV